MDVTQNFPDLGSCRSRIPEDNARDLFLDLYNVLVWAKLEDRQKAIQMVSAAYGLTNPF